MSGRVLIRTGWGGAAVEVTEGVSESVIDIGC